MPRKTVDPPGPALGQTRTNGKPSTLVVRLLGPFEIADIDGPIEIASKKLRALAAYLVATHPQPQPRDQLMTLLWGSHFEKQARQNLRQALLRLKQRLGADALVIDGETVGFRPTMLDSDLARVRRALKERTGQSLRAIADVDAADFLAGLSIAEEAWTEWLETERHRVRRHVADALVLLGEYELGENRRDAALSAAERVLDFDGVREDALRLLARTLAALGRSADAMTRFVRFETRLRDEFGTEPAEETRQLIATLQKQPGAQAALPPQELRPFPTIPEGISLAVLPFRNIGDDGRGAIVAAGLVEDIVTTLAKISHILVVARQSTLGYQKGATDRARVAREQGVRNALVGAVRISGDRVRVTAHLSDLLDGREIWADRFECQYKDLLEIQDEITKDVVSALQVKLTDGEQARVWARGTAHPVAWENIVVATEFVHGHHRDGIAQARQLAEEATVLDPEFSAAWAATGWTFWVEGRWGWAEPETCFRTALDYARRALALDPRCPDALGLRGVCALHVGAFDDAIQTMEDALLNAPGHAHIVALTGYVHRYCGDAERAVACMRRAMRLSPVHPPWYLVTLGCGLWRLGRREEALSCLREAADRDGEFTHTLAVLAAYLAASGHLAEARSAVRDLLSHDPAFSASEWNRHTPYSDGAEREATLCALHKAGAPD